MKKLTFSLLAVAFATGLASAQTAYTTPVGYETNSLPAGIEYNLMGLRLQKPTLAAGSLTAVSASTVSASAVDFDALLTAGNTYVLEITSGSFAGLVQEVVSWGTGSGNTANDLVTVANLSTLGVVAGDTFALRGAPTLEEIFGTNTLLAGFSALQADLVWVPDGAGDYTKYYISALVGNPWRDAGTGLNAPNVPVIYQDGLLVQKRAASPTSNVVVSGEVKLGGTITPILAGTSSSPSYNVIGTVYPAGATLQNSGILTNLLKGFSALQADIVWVPNGAGDYTKYYVSSLVGNPLKNVGTGLDVTTDVVLTSGIIIERKSTAFNINMTPPPSYQNL